MIHRFQQLASNRYIVWLLIVIGVLRSVLLLMAYSPAHASDSLAYFFYAERLGGYDLPDLDHTTYPFYPVLIYLTTWGSVYVLIAVQFLMSVALAPLYYLALKSYSPTLALIVAAVIVSDFQVAILFNFTSSEPLYIFLLAITLYLTLAAARQRCARGWCAADVLVGVFLVALLLTRSVARYMLPAFMLILWLVEFNWRRPVAVLGGFLVSLGVWAIISLAVLGKVEGLATQEFFLWGSYPNNFAPALSASNGPNSQVFVDARRNCPSRNNIAVAHCLEVQTGSWETAISVLRGTTLETIRVDTERYFKDIREEIGHLLATTGLMFAYPDSLTPGSVQCESPNQRLNRNRLMSNHVTVGLVNAPEEKLVEVEAKLNEFRAIMCPHLPENLFAKQVVDQLSAINITHVLASRYHNETGRYLRDLWYEPVIIYLILPLMTLVIPRIRKRFMPVVLATVSCLAFHALAGAVVFNVQPNRFAVVTNPLRTLILLYLGYVLVQIVIWAVNRFRTQMSPSG